MFLDDMDQTTAPATEEVAPDTEATEMPAAEGTEESAA